MGNQLLTELKLGWQSTLFFYCWLPPRHISCAPALTGGVVVVACSAHEAELLRKMEQRRAMLQEHEGVARSAVQDAEAERARHQEHLQALNPLKE